MASTLVLLLQLLLVSLASASHYMGGTLTFTHKGRNPDGTFRVDIRQRDTYDGCQYSHNWQCLTGFCGSATTIQRGILDQSTSAPQYNTRWCETETVRRRNIPSDKPFQLRVAGCCWIPRRDSGRWSSGWRLMTRVDLGTRSDTGKPNSSPDIAILPFLRVPKNCPRTYNLMSFDPDGDKVRCRYGNVGNHECSSCNQHSGFHLNQDSCTLHYQHATANPGVFGFEMVVEDFPQRSITLNYTDGSQSVRAPLTVRNKRYAPYYTTPWWWYPTTTTPPSTTHPYWWWYHTTTTPPSTTHPYWWWWWYPTTTTPSPTTHSYWWWYHTTTAAPTTSTAAPTTTSAAPTTSTAAPTTTTTAAPTTTTAAPTTTSTAAPTTSTAAPTTAAPTTSTAAPTTTSTAAPTTSTAAPTTTPAASTTTPAAPTTSTAAPTTTPAAPTTTPAAPTTSTAAPTTTPAAPTTTPAAPTTTTTAPTTTSAAPTRSTAAPTTSTAVPTAAVQTTNHAYATTPPLSKLPLQFSFLVDPPAPSCMEGWYLPKLVHPTPENGARIQAEVNKEVEIRVKAQATHATIYDVILSGPLNISKHRIAYDEFAIRWTPIPDDLGNHYPICFAVEAATGSAVTISQFTQHQHQHQHQHPTPSSQSGIYQSEMRCVLVDIVKKEVKSNVICTESTMTIEVEKSSLLGLREGHLRLSDPTDTACSLQRHSNSTHIIAVIPLNSCGTQIEEDDDNLFFKNEITTDDDEDDLITRKHLLELQFFCQYPKRGNVSAGFTAHRKSVTVWEKGFGTFTYQFEFFPNSQFQTRIDPNSYPLVYEVGSRIFMEIEATSSVNNTELFVESCRAAPYDNPNYQPAYSIIENGCNVDSTVVVHSPSHERHFKFSMEAFKFIGLHDQVYISCSVLMCEAGAPNTRCSQGCINSSWPHNHHHHHGKREAVTQSSTHFVSQGPLRLRRSAESTESPVVNLNLNVVFIAGCLLAAVGMISAVVMYKAKMSKVKYQPLPTFET